ncbi:IS481 family transposase [Mycoavidus sp. B2-EB]|nr:IS481 family transposase [Mycoavidus sp. B2-EB]
MGQAIRRAGGCRGGMPTLWRLPGEMGLSSMSRRPHNSPNRKVTQTDQDHILRMYSENKGARRIQNELRLYEQKELSLRTIHKVLIAAKVNPLVKPKRSIPSKRYSLLIPGERVQTG